MPTFHQQHSLPERLYEMQGINTQQRFILLKKKCS